MVIDQYTAEMQDFQAWLWRAMADFSPVTISRDDYRKGVDALPDSIKMLVSAGYQLWLDSRHYELSYNQCCKACFAAMRKRGILTVEG